MPLRSMGRKLEKFRLISPERPKIENTCTCRRAGSPCYPWDLDTVTMTPPHSPRTLGYGGFSTRVCRYSSLRFLPRRCHSKTCLHWTLFFHTLPVFSFYVILTFSQTGDPPHPFSLIIFPKSVTSLPSAITPLHDIWIKRCNFFFKRCNFGNKMINQITLWLWWLDKFSGMQISYSNKVPFVISTETSACCYIFSPFLTPSLISQNSSKFSTIPSTLSRRVYSSSPALNLDSVSDFSVLTKKHINVLS